MLYIEFDYILDIFYSVSFVNVTMRYILLVYIV